MFGKRYLRMGIISLLLIMLLGTDSVLSFAVGPGDLLHREITSREEAVIEETPEDDIVDESSDQESAETDIAGLSDEQIWAQIDKNELRSYVDVEELEEQIDRTALLSKINKKEIEKKINNTNLLASLSADEIRDEFYSLKDSDVLKPYMSIVYSLDDGADSDEFNSIDNLEDNYESDISDDLEDIEDFDDMSPDDSDGDIERIAENGAVDISMKSEDYSVIPLNNAEEEISIEESDKKVITKVVPVTPVDGISSSTDRLADVVNVQYPIVGENSPFDFIVDPLGLIYETAAARYGGGLVEEGAGVLFRNTDSGYSFSGRSDLLSIVNRGNVPVKVEIIAKMTYSGQAKIVDDLSKLTGSEPSMFFGLMGEDGLLSVFTQEGETVIDMILEPVPEGTYAYIWNAATNRYDTKMLDGVDESKFDGFKFGVMANCNREGNWSGVTSLPTISVTWKTEPIYTDWDLVYSELEDSDKPLFSAYKRYKLHELRQQELERLMGIALDDLVSEELDRLIDIEVEKLARERFYEIKGEGYEVDDLDEGDDSDETDGVIRRRSSSEDDDEDLDVDDEEYEEEEEEEDLEDLEEEEEEEEQEEEEEEPEEEEFDDVSEDEGVQIIDG